MGFWNLKSTLTEALILQHFDQAKAIIVQMDASGFVITVILHWYDVFGVLRPVNFYSEECAPAKQNYDTYDRELLAVVEILKQWQQYRAGANYKVPIRCDHKHFEHFQNFKVLSRSQARWSEILSAYDFFI